MSTVCTRSKSSLTTQRNPSATRSSDASLEASTPTVTKPRSSTAQQVEASSQSSITIAMSNGSSTTTNSSSSSSSSSNGEGGGLVWEEEDDNNDNEVSCTTPRGGECQIPEFRFCPPAPRKRKPHFTLTRPSFHPCPHFLPVLDFDSIFLH